MRGRQTSDDRRRETGDGSVSQSSVLGPPSLPWAPSVVERMSCELFIFNLVCDGRAVEDLPKRLTRDVVAVDSSGWYVACWTLLASLARLPQHCASPGRPGPPGGHAG